PGEPTILNNAALSYMQAGDLDGAENLLRQVTPGTPDYARIAQNLALVQSLRAAQPEKAPSAALPASSPALPAPMIVAEMPAQAVSAKLPPPPDVAAAPAVVSEPTKSAEITPSVPEPTMV